MNNNLTKILNIFKKTIIVQFIFLVFMSIFRIIFFLYFNTINDTSIFLNDIINSFILGARVDLTVIGYIQAPITLLFILLYYINNQKLISFINYYIKYYLFILYILCTLLLISDFGFYSYFKDHINILYFGLFEDDTYALMITMWENYNVVLILSLYMLFLIVLYFIISKVLDTKDKSIDFIFDIKNSIFIFTMIFLLNFLVIRGTFGMYPLGKMIPNISENSFINNLSQNGIRAFMKAYKIRKKYKNNEYDLIKMTGFKNNIEDAFRIYTNKENIDTKNLLSNITHTTSRKESLKDYNLVVIMVESFGMPILKYNSDSFNIMGSLKPHFEKDTLFTNFISSGDGTISSLDSLILNIPRRPGSFAFAQSKYKQTSFDYTPAFVFKKDGYEPSFIYGGDLTWRDIGGFIKYQGYDNTYGKINIFNSIKDKKYIEDDYFHPWGIFDEYLYDFIYNKLEKANKKQYIFALSTNNHPPYNTPKDYKIKPLKISKDLEKHITADLDLMQKRFNSYQYALDSVGQFLTKLKNNPKLSKNTIVVITADNNTIAGNMKYDKDKLLNSKNIPFYIYIPKELKDTLSIDTTVFGSHKDIFPTLYNILLSDTSYISLGTNMLHSKAIHIGVNRSKVIASKNGIVKIDKLNKDYKEQEANYYRSILAISEYLIKQYDK
ncbi:MAG: LTA synthase family protein [Epsilonproteobacteria bacterium]|nr:MAG: LTA synthase family protein [Campylobacterota bacterium]